jgi:predicted AlkP superfamily pyrophosphatase or phosphodiesterase
MCATRSRAGVLAALILLLTGCQWLRPAPPRAIVILVSIDGWRWDYLSRFSPPALTRLAAEGVRSEGLIPQFPSKTFPNHYTLVTGLRPARHGIVSNNMVAPDVPGDFAMSNRDVLSDPRWWGGEPVWNTAERQGLLSAPFLWPGSETAIGGRHPAYWRPFDNDLPDADRVAQVLEWLRLPEGKRPSFITLYFSRVDTAGHREGPDSDAVRAAALTVDASIGALVEAVERLGLSDRVHYIVVSDHGMAALAPDRMIVLDDYVDPATVKVVDWAPVLALLPNDGNVDALYAALKDKHPALKVYRNAEIPAEYGLAGHPRVPPVVAIAEEGWFITSRREMARWAEGGEWQMPRGTHGYDVRLQSMRGLFVAAGPRLARGVVVPPFENIHVYGLICAILGIEPAPNDGDVRQIGDIWRTP